MNFKKIWQKPQHQPKVIPLLDNIFSAITHGIGSGLVATALVLLIVRAVLTHSPLRVVTFSIYGTSLVFLYLSLTLYRSLIYTKTKKVFQISDHSSVFLSIAGCYTPYSLVVIGGAKGWLIFGIIRGITVFGILYCILAKNKNNIIEATMYIAMGWLVIFSVPQLYSYLGTTGFWLLVAGGISYTIGTLFYSTIDVPMTHTVWRLSALAGSILMFFSVLLYV